MPVLGRHADLGQLDVVRRLPWESVAALADELIDATTKRAVCGVDPELCSSDGVPQIDRQFLAFATEHGQDPILESRRERSKPLLARQVGTRDKLQGTGQHHDRRRERSYCVGTPTLIRYHYRLVV